MCLVKLTSRDVQEIAMFPVCGLVCSVVLLYRWIKHYMTM